MTDYTKLVEALRLEAEESVLSEILTDAAAAIEALQAEVDTLKRTDAKRCQECLYLGQPVEQQLPKRGEWKCSYPEIEPNPMFMYGICSICGFEQSISNKLNYCPNCGAKMEVQS